MLLRAPLSLSLAVAALGCHSPEYQKFIEQQEQWASTGADSSGTTGDGGSSGALTTSPADTSDGGSTSADNGETTGTAVSGSTGPDTTTGLGEGTSSDPGDTSTTGAEPFCGDGVVNTPSEECDPEVLDPKLCSLLCQRPRIIFVTSIVVNGKLSGLQGADAYCRSQALKAQMAAPTSPIQDPTNFKALLPSSTESIADRHFLGKGPYRLVNGLTVSDSFVELFSKPLQNPINVDEFSQTHNTYVWTASTADSLPYPGIDFCGGWSGVKGSASIGRSDRTDAWWIEVSDEVVGQPTEDCALDLALYCVEQQ